MSEPVVAMIYSEIPALGYGHRQVVLFDEGRKLVSVCHIPTATVARVDRASLVIERIEDRPRWRYLRRCLKERIKASRRWRQEAGNVGFKIPQAVKALAKQLDEI